MLDTFQGLPVHALIVHATVVVVPVTALMVGLAAVYPKFRNWIGWLPPVAAVASVFLVWATRISGQDLYDRFKRVGGLSDDIKHHKDLAQLLLWLVIPMAVIAVAAYLLQRRDDASKAVLAVVAVLAVASAGAVAVDVALIGHAGAKASWKPIIDGTNQAK
jgi:hypothetical protein